MINDMLNHDVIEPAHGPWSSPVVLVKKKDGSSWFCIDFRCLNSVTRKDAHPLPHIDDTLDALSGAQWFSTIDLASGYWQVQMEHQDRTEESGICDPVWIIQIQSNAVWIVQRSQHILAADGAYSGRAALSTCLIG